MPDWAYYQQNGKTAEENYRDMINKNRRKLNRKYSDNILEDFIMGMLEQTTRKALDEIFDGFDRAIK